MTEQQQQQQTFQLIDDENLVKIDPQIIYQQYAILRAQFINAIFYVQKDFDLSCQTATLLQQKLNENRMYRDQYLKDNMELKMIQQRALQQSQLVKKMEKTFQKRKEDTIEDQKNLQSQLERSINESATSRDNVKKTYGNLEDEYDALLRDSLSELVEEIQNIQHDLDVLNSQKEQIKGASEQEEGKEEEVKALLEKSKEKITNDLEEKKQIYASLDGKEAEIQQSKKDAEELHEDKKAFIDKLKKDNEEMDKTIEELRKQLEEKKKAEENKEAEKPEEIKQPIRHVTNLEERLFVEWFQRFGITVNDFKSDLQDGLLICQVIDKIRPGSVHWNKLVKPKSNKPLNIFQRRTNCTVLCDIAAELGIMQTGIGSQDLTDGNVKMVMGFLRQLMSWESSVNKGSILV